MNLGLSGDPTNGLDVYAGRSATDWGVLLPMMNYLVQNYQRGDGVGPDLAQRWTVSSDGTVYTFNLSPDAKWQDGRPVIADDVVASITRLQTDKTINPPYRYTVAGIAKAEAVDAKTVRLTLNNVSASFLPQLGAIGNVIYPSHIPLSQFAELKPVGSGAYKLQSFAKAGDYKLTRSDSYFKKGIDGNPLPYLDGLDLFVIPDLNARITAFRAGRLDVHSVPGGTVTPSQFATIKGDVTDAVSFTGIPGHWRWYFNNVAPWNDLRVRQAMSLAFDRKFFDDAVNQGQGDPTQLYNYSEKASGKWSVPSATIATWPGFRADKTQDIATAKSLLQQANVDLTKLNISILTLGIYQIGATVAQQVLKTTLGVDAALNVMDTVPGIQAIAQGKFAIAFDQNGPAVDDPQSALAPFFTTGAPTNYAKWSDPQVDQLLKSIDSTLDTAQRKALSNQAEQTLINLAWAVPVGGVLSLSEFARGYVKNYRGHIQSQDGPAYRFEDVWLAR